MREVHGPRARCAEARGQALSGTAERGHPLAGEDSSLR
jgi:hypothetical protein